MNKLRLFTVSFLFFGILKAPVDTVALYLLNQAGNMTIEALQNCSDQELSARLEIPYKQLSLLNDSQCPHTNYLLERLKAFKDGAHSADKMRQLTIIELKEKLSSMNLICAYLARAEDGEIQEGLKRCEPFLYEMVEAFLEKAHFVSNLKKTNEVFFDSYKIIAELQSFLISNEDSQPLFFSFFKDTIESRYGERIRAAILDLSAQ